ncbi:MAG: hypothetical protein ACPG7F_18340 [Aggregatilineales bacterium]
MLGLIRLGIIISLVLFVVTGGTVIGGPFGAIVTAFLAIGLLLGWMGLGIGKG